MRHLLPRVLLGLVAAGIGLGMGLGLATAPEHAWSSTFCQPIDRVIGVDVNRISLLEPSTTSEMGLEGVLLQLHKDVEAALAAAPTSQFDRLARTQLERCGVRPLN